MNCVLFANNVAKIIILLSLCWAAVVSANSDETVLQLSIAPLEGTRLQDGHLLGRGRVACTREHTTFKVWMAPEYLAPDQRSYVSTLSDNRQVKFHIRLQGPGWQQAMPLDQGIIKHGAESSTMFDIVAHGEQNLLPGVYALRINGACV